MVISDYLSEQVGNAKIIIFKKVTLANNKKRSFSKVFGSREVIFFLQQPVKFAEKLA